MSTHTIAHRIKSAREEAELSIIEVSRLVAVVPETYKEWENGDSQPRANKLVTLAGVLNVVPAWLLEGDDDYLQNLDRDNMIIQLKKRLAQMQSAQNKMLTMLDELTCDIDDIAKQD